MITQCGIFWYFDCIRSHWNDARSDLKFRKFEARYLNKNVLMEVIPMDHFLFVTVIHEVGTFKCYVELLELKKETCCCLYLHTMDHSYKL